MSTGVSSALVSSLLDTLQQYLQQSVPDIQNYLTGKGVDSNVAAIVAQAVSTADGNPVYMGQGGSITLNQVLSPFLPADVTPPSAWSSVAFSDLSFTANMQDSSFGFGGNLTCPISVAGLQLQFDAELSLSSTVSNGTRQTSGDLSGTLEFATATFSATYEFDPDSDTLTADWSPTDGSTVDLNDLCSAIVTDVPTGALTNTIAHLTLTKASFDLDLSETTTLTMEAQCQLGSAFVVIQSSGSTPVLALGCQLGGGSSSIGIDQLSQFDFTVPPSFDLSLGAAVMLASTGTIANFQVPNPNLGVTWPFESYPLTLQAGFTVGALLDLTDSSAITFNIQNVIAQANNPAPDYLLLEVQFPALDLTVELGQLQLMKSPFTLDLSLTIFTQPTFAVEFTGSCTIANTSTHTSTLNGLTFSASLTVTDESVMGDLDFSYETGFNPPLPYLKGLWIYELAGMMGLDFDKQEVTLGIMGMFSIGTQPQSSSTTDSNYNKLNPMMPAAGKTPSQAAPYLQEDEFALIMGVNDDAVVVPIPDVDLLILRLSSIKLTDFLTCTLGKGAPSISSPVLTNLWAKDIQIYWCDDSPGGLRLPDGTPAATGFQFQGAFNFWDKLQAWSDIDVTLASQDSSTPGASTQFIGQFYVSPISMRGMLTITSDGKTSPPSSMLTAMKDAGISSGGPYFDLDTNGPTYLAASWQIKLLDWTDTISVTVTSDLFTFTFANQDSTNFTSDFFTCTLSTDTKRLEVHFSGYLNGSLDLPVLVGLALGSVLTGQGTDEVINATYDAIMVVDVSDGFSLTLNGTFSFDNDTRVWSLPHISLTDEIDKWGDIPGTLLDYIGQDAESIFKDALVEAGTLIVQNIDKTWGEISNQLDSAYDDIKNTIGEFFGIHKTQREKTPWLRNSAIVSAVGSDPSLSDPKDPNYTDQSVYRIRGLQRIYIPDQLTLTSLRATNSYTFFEQPDSEFDPDYVVTIPVAATEWPSIADGTIYWDYNGGNPNRVFLAVSCYRDGITIPTHYEIQTQAPQTYVNTVANPPTSNPPVELKLPCASVDIQSIAGSPLSACCLLTPTASATTQPASGAPIVVFFDGICRHVPDPSTLAILDPSKVGKLPVWMPELGFNGIPQGPGLTALTDGDLVMSSTQTPNQPVYYIDNSQLLHVPNMEAMSNWGFSLNNVIAIDDQTLSILAMGGELPENPPGS
jgi:hypothetical protein